jgi:hypothetical protein
MAILFDIHITNKAGYTLLTLAIVIVLSLAVFAYTSALPDPGHGGDSVLVSVNDKEMTLQKAIDDSLFTEKPTEIDYSECVGVTKNCDLSCPSGYGMIQINPGAPCGSPGDTTIKCCKLKYPK